MALVAKALQRGDRSDRDRAGFFEGHAGWFLDHRPVFGNADVLRKGPAPSAEHLIARLELRHFLADRFDRPREVDAQDLLLWFEHSERRSWDVRQAGQEVPIRGVDGCRADADQHPVISHDRPRDLLELEDVGLAVTVLDGRPHGAEPLMTFRTTFPVLRSVSTYRVASITFS